MNFFTIKNQFFLFFSVFFSAKQNFNGNIITVDWKKGVAEWSDHELIKNTEFTGKRVKDLIEHFKDNLSDIEIIGHGIGAHVAGIGMHSIV